MAGHGNGRGGELSDGGPHGRAHGEDRGLCVGRPVEVLFRAFEAEPGKLETEDAIGFVED